MFALSYIDNLPRLEYKSNSKLTINKGYYDNTVFELATTNDNIKLENNKVIGINAGYFFIDVTKMETAQYSALSKRMSGYVQKLDQPKVEFINLNTELKVNPNNLIELNINKQEEDAAIMFTILTNSPVSGKTNVCNINNNKLSALNEGTCVIQAVTAETLNYKSSYSDTITIWTEAILPTPA